MLNPKQLTQYVVEPTLKAIGLYSVAATQLLMGTFLMESGLSLVHQLPNGPGRGLGQVENTTYQDVKQRIQEPRYAPLYAKILTTLNMQELPKDADALMGNLVLAVIFTRLKYYLDRRPMPEPGDINGFANYWGKVYNAGATPNVDMFAKLLNNYLAT